MNNFQGIFMRYLLLLFFIINILDAQNTNFIHYKENSKLTYKKNDIYYLVYKNKECILYKNHKKIPLFDKRFNVPEPKTPYTCSVWQKENYISCLPIEEKNITAFALSFGVYPRTNLLFGMKSAHPSIQAEVKIKCSKQSSFY